MDKSFYPEAIEAPRDFPLIAFSMKLASPFTKQGIGFGQEDASRYKSDYGIQSLSVLMGIRIEAPFCCFDALSSSEPEVICLETF